MPILEITIIILLILANGLLSMSELAIVSARRSGLQARADAGNRGARRALQLIDDPGGFLATVQIGITLVAIVAGAFGGATIAERLGDALDGIAWIAPHGHAIAITAVVALITYASLVAGELVPKRIALSDPERIAAIAAEPMHVLSAIAAPAVWLLRHSTDAVLRRLGLAEVRDTAVTEDEVRWLIANGTRTGVFVPQERAMIDGVLRLADRSVRAVMTPRAAVDWVDLADDSRSAVEKIAASRHTRLVVCEQTIDHARGVVDMRDVLPLVFHGETVDLAASMRKPLVVSEAISVLTLIDLFRRQSTHFAVVVDEYGTTQGVVTATDVLEGIAGELPEQGEPAGPTVSERADGSWLVDGLLPIDEFAGRFNLGDLRSGGDFETLAGFVMNRLGHLPVPGERLTYDGLTIEVVDLDDRRIDKVLVTFSGDAAD